MVTCSPGTHVQNVWGLSVTLKAGTGNAQVAVGSCGSVVRAPEAKQDSLQLLYTNTDRMKDLWCSSTVLLLSTQILMW